MGMTSPISSSLPEQAKDMLNNNTDDSLGVDCFHGDMNHSEATELIQALYPSKIS